MASAKTRKSASPITPPEPRDWGLEVLGSPWLWAPALTIGFYQALPHLKLDETFVYRYFCSHWTLYAEMGAFFLGACVLVRKALGLISQNRALKVSLLDDVDFAEQMPATDRAIALWESTTSLSPATRRSCLLDRLREVCQFVVSRKGSQGLEEHLRYLADLAADGLSSSYAAVRTITWAIPILGFLGTVIGITMAIANISGEQLSSSLSEVTAGLAVAFDTTALALTLSMILVFSTYLVERGENHILSEVEQFAVTQLAPCFPMENGPVATPLASAEMQAADQLLRKTEELIAWQTQLWQSALENLRGRWLETAEQQQSEFTRALAHGMSTSLAGHEKQLAEARAELLGGFRGATAELARVVEVVRETGLTQQSQFSQQISTVWQRMQEQLVEAREDQAAQASESTRLLSTAVEGWHQDLQGATEAIHSQLVELQKQGAVLREVAGNEAELIRLQTTLQNNLQAVRNLEAFEESIHSLNAAVHLLTARARPHAA